MIVTKIRPPSSVTLAVSGGEARSSTPKPWQGNRSCSRTSLREGRADAALEECDPFHRLVAEGENRPSRSATESRARLDSPTPAPSTRTSAGRVSHPRHDKRSFMASARPPFPSDQQCLVAQKSLCPRAYLDFSPRFAAYAPLLQRAGVPRRRARAGARLDRTDHRRRDPPRRRADARAQPRAAVRSAAVRVASPLSADGGGGSTAAAGAPTPARSRRRTQPRS